MTDPRVLMVSFLTPPFSFAGAGNQAMLLSQKLQEAGLDVEVITSGGQGKLWQLAQVNDVSVIRLLGSRHKLLNMVLFNVMSLVWWLLHSQNYDLVHIHGCTNLTTLLWIPLARLFGKPCLLKVTCSGVDDLSGLARFKGVGPIAKWIAKQASGFIALTPGIAADLAQEVPPNKLFVIPNGYDDTHFAPLKSLEAKRAKREALGLPVHGRILTYTGGINPRKNVHFLVEAFAQLKQTHPDLTLCLVGPCKEKFVPYGEKVRARIEALGLTQSVVLTGEVPYQTVAGYLQASDLFVFASSQEGLPSSPIEAMACGVPGVVVELPGVTDWLYADHTHTDVVPSTIQDFVGAVTERLANPDALRARAELACADASRRFKAEAVAHAYQTSIYPALR